MKKRPVQIYFGILAVAFGLIGAFQFGEGKTIGLIWFPIAAFFAWGYFDDKFK
ncbi:hypothetical protein OAL85_03520 [Methylophilaceae bacterium]|nr:hypothetical protein [Methylophilaceae bacterium]